MNFITKLITNTLTQTAKSIVTSELKQGAKKIIASKRAKTPDQIHKEINQKLGYVTDYFSIDKEQTIKFKSSPIALHEYITKSPVYKNKFLRDQETNKIFFERKEVTPEISLRVLDSYSKSTGINSPSLLSHIQNAYKLLESDDINKLIFRETFYSKNNTSVIDNFFTKSFSLADSENHFYDTMFKKWCIGTAKRILNPGSSHDSCFVLRGEPGIGKTLFFRSLFPESFKPRYGEVYCDLKNPQKFVENIVGKSIVCFDELSVLDYDKSEEIFKQILSSENITVRLAWKRDPQTFALRQSFCGTTNKTKFIKDTALYRRLKIVDLKLSKIDLDFVKNNRDNLWNEAIKLADSGANYHLTEEEKIKLSEINAQYHV